MTGETHSETNVRPSTNRRAILSARAFTRNPYGRHGYAGEVTAGMTHIDAKQIKLGS